MKKIFYLILFFSISLIFWFALTERIFAQVDSLSWESVTSQDWKRPEKLDYFIGVHPRLLLTKDWVRSLKNKITTTHKGLWQNVKSKADSYIGNPPLSDYSDQKEMRSTGRGIPWQALAYMLTGDTIYFECAKRWILALCKYPRWGNNRSLAAGECLFGVSIGYDWLYNCFTSDERKIIREKLIYQAEAMISKPPVHHNRWLANHNHIEHNGLAAAGLVLYDEVPQAIDWIRQADLVFRTMFKVASHDGSSTEGHQYWAYSMDSILKFAEIARDLMEENFYQNPWLKNAAYFIISSTIPNFNYKNSVMSYGDSFRDYGSNYGYAGPTHILYRLAAEYNNGYTQWLASRMTQQNISIGDYYSWCNLLWYDENVKPKFISDLHKFWYFEDTGWITTRSSWDEDAILIGFKCGPFHGHKVQPYYEIQVDENWPKFHRIIGGHGHPDVNSFQIYAYGKWLAIDPGYEKPKRTRNHNTILVNGIGQLGEGKRWFDRESVMTAKASSAIIRAESYNDYDYIIGDAGNIYPDSLGLKKFYRHLLFIKPDFIVIIDELVVNSPTNFQWLLNSEAGLEIHSDKYCLIKNGNVFMDVHFLLPEKITTTNGDISKAKIFVDGTTQNVLIADFKCNKETLMVSVLHPRRFANKVSNVSIISYTNSMVNLWICCGMEKKRIQVDITDQRVYINKEN